MDFGAEFLQVLGPLSAILKTMQMNLHAKFRKCFNLVVDIDDPAIAGRRRNVETHDMNVLISQIGKALSTLPFHVRHSANWPRK